VVVVAVVVVVVLMGMMMMITHKSFLQYKTIQIIQNLHSTQICSTNQAIYFKNWNM
jgi:hypothetical protein